MEKEVISLIFEDEDIKETDIETISGRGLPFEDDPNRRGDLIVRFKFVTENESDHVETADSANEAVQQTVTKNNLPLTLEEVLRGCDKQVAIERVRFDLNGNKTTQEHTVQVSIKPGILTGTEITIPQEGDELPGNVFADLVFIVTDAPHKLFKRDRIDLKYTAKVSESQLQNRDTILVPTLDGKTRKITLDGFDVDGSGRFKQIFGLGLPYPSDPKMKGSMLIHLDIVTAEEAQQCAFQEPVKMQTLVSEKSTETKVESKKSQTQLPPNKISISLTLEEIVFGCTKTQIIQRKLLDERNKVVKIENEELTLEFKPGSIDGTTIDYPKMGDKQFGKLQADLVFFVTEEPHSIFKRVDHDLECTATISLQQAYSGKGIAVTTLNGTRIQLTNLKKITADTVEIIPNAGVPYLNEANKIGNLIIKLKIKDDHKVAQVPPIEQDLELSLEEIYSGTNKETFVNCQIVENNNEKKIIARRLVVPIRPGIEAGEKVIIPHEGNEEIGKSSGNVIFHIKEKPHELFKRNGANLLHVMTLSKEQMEMGGNFEIPTLASKTKTLRLEGAIKHNFSKKIRGYGLPLVDNPTKFGDLVVQFELVKEAKPKEADIEYPIALTLEQIFHGLEKHVKISRQCFDSTGKTTTKQEIITIPVKPGTVEGTQFRFCSLGDEKPDFQAADIVFISRDKPHMHFKRNGSNLEHLFPVTASEMQLDKGFVVKLPKLVETDTEIKLLVAKLTKFPVVYPGKGLPEFDNPEKRGDLIVKPKIVDNSLKGKDFTIRKEVTLENLIDGFEEKMTVKRKVIDLEGHEHDEENQIVVTIKKGAQLPMKIRYPRFGDQKPGHQIPGDVIVALEQKPHKFFKRSGANLVYILKVLASKAASFEEVIPLLNNDSKTMHFTNITKNSIEKIKSMGLPLEHSPNSRGDILIKFDILEDRPVKAQTKSYANAVEAAIKSKAEEPKTPQRLPEPDEPIVMPIEVSLEEINCGCTKSRSIQCKIVNLNEPTYLVENLNVNIPPGIAQNQKLVYKKVGNQSAGKSRGDVIFVVTEVPHKHFTRKGADIECNIKISFYESQNGFEKEIPLLSDGCFHLLRVSEKINTNTVEIIENQGLPHFNEPTKRGNLLVKFDIKPEPENQYKQNGFELLPASLPIEANLKLTFEQILNGFTGKYSIPVTIYDSNCNSSIRDHELELVIPPGIKSGERIVHIKQVQQWPNSAPADVHLIVEEIPHEYFTRDGADILYCATILKSQNFVGNQIHIPSLDQEKLSLTLSNIVNESTVIPITGQGFPFHNDINKRGDLLVKFKIVPDPPNDRLLAKLPQNPARVYSLGVTLEEIYFGCYKVVKIDRQISNLGGVKTYESVVLPVKIKRGVRTGTRIQLRGEGDRSADKRPGDVVVIIEEIPHSIFTRNGQDLGYIATVSATEARDLRFLNIPTIDGRGYSLKIRKSIKHDRKIPVPRLGLPHYGNTKMFGNLVVRFYVYEDGTNSSILQDWVRKTKRFLGF